MADTGHSVGSIIPRTAGSTMEAEVSSNVPVLASPSLLVDGLPVEIVYGGFGGWGALVMRYAGVDEAAGRALLKEDVAPHPVDGADGWRLAGARRDVLGGATG